MFNRLLPLALAAALPFAAHAAGDDTFDQGIADQVRAMLTEQGYEVRKIEFEDGLYEAYAIKDGEKMEVFVNAALEIVENEHDDED